MTKSMPALRFKQCVLWRLKTFLHPIKILRSTRSVSKQPIDRLASEEVAMTETSNDGRTLKLLMVSLQRAVDNEVSCFHCYTNYT